MPETWLSRFRARNFRSFGDVDLALPAAPGLVLLEGPNGLGKTSWMEALEWVLSGRVHRWSRQSDEHGDSPQQHIRRKGADAPASVSATFGEHEEARWNEGGADPEPATWLCADPDRWSLRADNLNGFLRGTHILPQSPSLRLLHQPAEDRWTQVLRVASGYSEIDDLSKALQGTKRPLASERDARKKRSDEARTALAAWRSRVAGANDGRARAEAAAALVSPAQAVATLASENAPVSADTEAGARELRDWISGRLASLRDGRREVDALRAGLVALADLPARWRAAVDARTEAEALVTSRDAEHLRLREAAQQRTLEETTATSRVEEASARDAAERERQSHLVALGENLSALPRLRDHLGATREAASAEEARLSEATAARDLARTAVEQRRASDARAEALQRRAAALANATAAWERLRELAPQHQALVQAGDARKTSVEVASAALEAPRLALNASKADTTRARELADAVRATAGEAQGLVAALARHIEEHTPECPLCLAPYGVGVLRKRVEEATKRQSPAIALAEEALREAVEREAAAVLALHEATEAHAGALRAYQGVQQELSALNREIAAQRARMPDVRAGADDEDLGALQRALDAEREVVAGLPGASIEGGPVLNARLAQADEALAAANAAHADAREAVERTASALAEAEARGVSLRGTLGLAADVSIDVQIAAARDTVATAGEALRAASQAKDAAADSRAQAQAAANAASEAAVSARAARDLRIAEEQALTRTWTEHTLDLPPGAATLDAADAALGKRIATLDARVASLVAAVEGLGRWLDHAALDAETQALDAEADGAGPDAWKAHAQRLAEQADTAEAAHARAAQARDDIERMANTAQAKRDSMYAALDARLRPVLAPMLGSLILDRTIAGAVIALSEARRKTRMTATVGASADLLALASEGQLSGVNLAVQLSMALAFRWSRWPAVLLDDPAQYSDVVHSTNLVETLRVLALHHRFQVFLATHERDFALYAERKFRNDGLPATRVTFRQPANPARGVVPRIAAI